MAAGGAPCPDPMTVVLRRCMVAPFAVHAAHPVASPTPTTAGCDVFSRMVSCGEAVTFSCSRHQAADVVQDLEASGDEDIGLPQRRNGCSSLWWLLALPALMLLLLFSRVPGPSSPPPHIPARAPLPRMTSMRLSQLGLGHTLLAGDFNVSMTTRTGCICRGRTARK